MDFDTKKIGTLCFFAFILLLGISCYAVRPKAEISMEGTWVGPSSGDSLIASEPTYYRKITCRRIDDREILAVSADVLAQQVEYELNAKLSDYSDFPKLASLDDCGEFFVITSVLGSSTMGIRLQMVFPKSESFFNGVIDKDRVLLFHR